MAIIEVKIPSPGESITHVELFNWLVKDGEYVEKDTEIAELESDKATLMLVAYDSGKISFKAKEGDMLEVGSVACTIDTSVQPSKSEKTAVSDKSAETGDSPKSAKNTEIIESSKHVDQIKISESSKVTKPAETEEYKNETQEAKSDQTEFDKVKITPLAQKVMDLNDLSVEDVINGLRRLKREDVEVVLNANESPANKAQAPAAGLKKEVSRESKTERLSSLRRKLSERLVSVKNETAMLTTFNEVDMKPIMDIRKRNQAQFTEKHGIKLGIMSFFMKASSVALLEFPNVNSMIEGENLVTYDFTDISVAVSAPKGLMVPVVRNVESLGLAEIEKAIADLAEKARNGRLSIPEMTGGTFTITNGGVFGSMMSTPLINPPQSAILGMHNIIERPVAIDGQVVIRPMMYVALSYDHRVIDGKDSVSFLKRIKQLLENPTDILFGGSNGEKALLEL
ncbi:MAG: 2-oxoglutarate dehydrogenase complex dihydrolipoyllysine-residue succinyltransferase [Fermentimonas sp.]|nr:2-oxoglutarate dehydrogenase complex dihydrolipoyllysine-residue succinyltransferase [Fermentimonas sp.]